MIDPIQAQLVAARKNQILDAAAVVFSEKGFHPTTIRDIAKHAGIADGTIYNYFENKTALLLAIFERMRTSIVPDIPPMPSPDTDFRIIVRTLLAYPLEVLQEDDFALFRIVASEMMVNDDLKMLYYEQILAPTLSTAEAMLQSYAAQHNIDPARISLTVRAISGLMLGLTLENIMGDPVVAEQWAALPDFLANLLLDGITTRD